MRRHRIPKVPKAKPFKVTQVKKPNLGELKKALEGYVSASEADRLNALAKAALWYEDGNANGALAYVLSNRMFPATEPEFKKSIDTADKCRQRAAGTTFNAERNTALCMAIRLYEKCCEKLQVPRLQEYMDRYEKQKQELADKVNNLQARFGEGLELIQKALGMPLKIAFCEECNQFFSQSAVNGCQSRHPDKLQLIQPTIEKLIITQSDRPRSIDTVAKSLLYNRDAALELQTTSRREGALVAVLREMPYIVRYSAVQKAADGQTWTTNRDSHLAFQAQALSNLETWLKSVESPNRLVRKGSQPTVSVTVSATVSTGQPQAVKPQSVSASRGEKGRKILEILKDGSWYTMGQLRNALGVSSVRSNLRGLGGQLEWGTPAVGKGKQVRLAQGGAA